MNINSFLQNPSKNAIFESEPDEAFKSQPCMLGIDEAGRGPVLGPMVYGCAVYPISSKSEMNKMDFADSKQLTENKRDEIFERILGMPDRILWITHVLSPNYISNSMLKRAKYNLNALSHDTAIGLIQRVLDQDVQVKEVYVDTVGPPEKYQEKLRKLFPNIKITVAKKADSLYPVVSAASICAKVIRDKCVKEWQFPELLDEKFRQAGYEYGSGYPGDPKTKAFLKDVFDKIFGFPTFIRFGWSTASTVIEKDGFVCNWEESEDEDEAVNKTASITTFFSKKDTSPKAHEEALFFKQRLLCRVDSFDS